MVDKEIKLTDEEEQEAKCLIVSERFPCRFRLILQKMGWVVDVNCPVKKKTIDSINKYFSDKENGKYEREYPDG